MKNKIKVNQKVFVKDGNGVAEKIVNKVGRKYFYVSIGHWSEMKFSIETME